MWCVFNSVLSLHFSVFSFTNKYQMRIALPRTCISPLCVTARRRFGSFALHSASKSLTNPISSTSAALSTVTATEPSSSMAAKVGAPQGHITLDPSKYPAIRRDDGVVEDMHGTKVADPYRWLEDPDSQETQAFVTAQNEVTQSILAQCGSRQQFKELFTKLYDYPKFGCPFRRGDRYYYYSNTGLQPQSVLMTASSPSDEGSVFFDPNTLSEDGTVALGGSAFSEDGLYWAYMLASGGSDWRTLHVSKVLADGGREDLPDKLEHVKFSSLAWTHDHKGFFYNRYPAPEGREDLGTETDKNENQQLWYHVLGTPQSEDVKVMELPEEPQWMIGCEVTDDGRYLLLSVSSGCLPANRAWYVDLETVPRNPETGALQMPSPDQLKVVKLVDNFDAQYSYVANEGTVFYLKTNLNAPRGKVVKVDITRVGAPETWQDVIPQHDQDLLQWVHALKGDRLITCWLRDVSSKLEMRSLSTGALTSEVQLPGIGSVSECTGRREDTTFFFKFSGFTEPGAIYRCDTEKSPLAPELMRRIQLSVPFNPEEFVTKQVFYESKDGTKIPMFIVHHKDTVLDGSNPTLLYGYGGFNISLTPSFSVGRLCWMLAYGGVYALANLRGGGEYGITWRNAGSVLNKQNVFDDFQAAAEYLHAEKYSSPSTLAIEGGSNGGLLVCACANQRPDLYACVLGHVGVLDMLRFHKFTIGHAWITDYGTPDKTEEFEYLLTYSPLHNVRVPQGGSQQYPAVMLTTGDHDDRVVPLHSHKHIAQLQYVLAGANPQASTQRNPLLTRVEVRAGHGAGKPTAKVIEEAADCYAFAAAVMGVPWRAAKL